MNGGLFENIFFAQIKDLSNYNKNEKISKEIRDLGNKLYKKKKHNKKIHKELLNLYSKSITFAPDKSEEQALSINNRSVLHLHCGNYKECIIDIDNALLITKSIKLKIKFLLRKLQCLILINSSDDNKELIINDIIKLIDNIDDNNDKDEFLINLDNIKNLKPDNNNNNNNDSKKIDKLKLEHDDDNNLPYISKSIKLKYDDKYGRYLIANKDIKTGEILIIEKSIINYPELHELYIVCSNCLKLTLNSIPCNNCSYAVYCSVKCLNNAYDNYHNIECCINPILFSMKISIDILITLRLFIKYLKKYGIKKIVQIAKDIHNDKDRYKKVCTNEELKLLCQSFNHCYSLVDNKKSQLNTHSGVYSTRLLLLKVFKNTNFFINDKDFYKHIDDLIEIIVNLSNICCTNVYLFQEPNLVNTEFMYKEGEPGFAKEVEENSGNIATTLDPISSLINHSCNPNVGRFNLEGPKSVIFAQRPIKENEQIFCSYGPMIEWDTNFRKSALIHGCQFECFCQPCVENWERAPVQLANILVSKIEAKFNLTSSKHLSYVTKPFELWKYEKICIKEISELIDFIYSYTKIIDATGISYKLRDNLRKIFYKLYSNDFNISDTCK